MPGLGALRLAARLAVADGRTPNLGLSDPGHRFFFARWSNYSSLLNRPGPGNGAVLFVPLMLHLTACESN